MTTPDILVEGEEVGIDADISQEAFVQAKEKLAERCKASGILFEERKIPEGERALRVGMKSGRNQRWLTFWHNDNLIQFLSSPFEKYIFLTDLEAICSYSEGTIEAALRPIGPVFMHSGVIYQRLFGVDPRRQELGSAPFKISLTPPQENLPQVEISLASEIFNILVPWSRPRVTLKLTDCHVTTHDAAHVLLTKMAESILFQLDLLTNTPMALESERRRLSGGARRKKKVTRGDELQYPKTEFDSAPLSLYWYARSAAGMPLLQFLAFYQVIEFYFPIYSHSEAQRKLKGILKDPTFRSDRDTDISKLLSAIQINRSGAFGDEKSQLRATLMECVDADMLRTFLEEDEERKDFFLTKAKTLPYHRIALANPSADLRNDVADRVYDIRCKIVHTKTDTREGGVELLLPFSKEAEQLSFDIELVQYLAQLILIAGSRAFDVNS